MATIHFNPNFPHIPVLTGNELCGTDNHINRRAVKSFLFSDANGIRNYTGQIDFIICNVVDAPQSNFNGVDHSISPRPLRGIIQIVTNPSNIDTVLLSKILGIVAHEVGHYWLVPGNGQIRIGTNRISTPTIVEVAKSLNFGNGIPDYPIIGRQNRHWSPYIDAEDSPMDGINHSPEDRSFEESVGFAYSRGIRPSGYIFTYEPFGEIVTSYKYSKFELSLAGVLRPPFYLTNRASVRYFRPQWVYPLDFQTGLYAELDDGQIWYFGFDQGPQMFSARRIDNYAQKPPVNLPEPFNPYSRVALRIVRKQGRTFLQARVFVRDMYNLQGCAYAILRKLGIVPTLYPESRSLTALSPAQMFADITGGTINVGTNIETSWVNLAEFHAGVRKIGLGTRSVFNTHNAFIETEASLYQVIGNTTSDVFQHSMQLVNEIQFAPGLGVSALLRNGNLIYPDMIEPANRTRFPHTNSIDKAPRLVMNAPKGEFAFGGDVRIKNCLATVSAGMNGADKWYVGKRGSFYVSNFDIADEGNDEDRTIMRADPIDKTYHMLFCLVSRTQLSQQDEVARLTGWNHVRTAWERYFSELMYGRRLADTNI